MQEIFVSAWGPVYFESECLDWQSSKWQLSVGGLGQY